MGVASGVNVHPSPVPITHATCHALQTSVSVRLIASTFASSTVPASPIWLRSRLSCAGQSTVMDNGHHIQRNAPSLRLITHMPCQADFSQRAVGRQCLCKLRSASSADLVASEIELRRAERSRHSVGQWASHPTQARALLRHVNHALRRATRT